ncbi:MAG: cation:proton antiporter [Bacteroidales bacterium]|nr:cation:proton antiporter [Bacteroidales bacterium]MDT8430409.1 cation:proton antiporter [Bacteroidales bacterium]
MHAYQQILYYVLAFIFILFSSSYFAKFFNRLKLPLITGFLVTGIICGPHVLDLIEADALKNLGFVNDLALAFIAYAAGAELYLKDIRIHVRSIAWNTFGQVMITFVFGTIGVLLLSDFIPFMKDMSSGNKVAVAMLVASIFVARSPSSAIAIISELRAKGPFTQIVMGVTILKDVLVILLFSISLSIAVNIISGAAFNMMIILLLLAEIALAFLMGYFIGRWISLVLSVGMNSYVKMMIILATGYATFFFTHSINALNPGNANIDIHIEPLLISIVASFWVTNYSKHRMQFQKMIDEAGPAVYVAFFTLVGAMLSLDILAKVWMIAVILFFVRLISVIIGSGLGAFLAGDPRLYRKIGWMPYVTQAGVGLGLATEVAGEFSGWGGEFATIIIAVIVLNQLVGPPLFKWAIQMVGESHRRGEITVFDGVRNALIFGLEDQSVALARQLQMNDWKVKIATLKKWDEVPEIPGIQLEFIDSLDIKSVDVAGASKAEVIVLMLSDQENVSICDIVYEHVGTKEIVVRLNDRKYFKHFNDLGAQIVEPYTAVIGLLDHFVRAPIATSLILGMDARQDAEDFEVRDKRFHGMAIRDLKLPADLLILSVKRKGHMVVTHGYTRLRKKDIVTAVGSTESLEKMRLQFEDPGAHKNAD